GGGDEERDQRAALASDQIADPHEQGGQRREQGGGTQVVHRGVLAPDARPASVFTAKMLGALRSCASGPCCGNEGLDLRRVRRIYPLMASDRPDRAEIPAAASRKRLSPAAERALAEAATGRAERQPAEKPGEVGGRGGLDPVRYGDWEVAGRASDF